MKKSLKAWQITGFVFTSIAGTLLHFLYDWTNQNVFAGLFSAVNESIWEHMKLLFFPLFVFVLIQSRYIGKEFNNFWCVKLVGISSGLLLIPLLYYSYTGIFGVNADWFNITIFFIAAAFSYIIETLLFKKHTDFCLPQKASFLILLLILLLFIILTFNPPQISLFQDPITKTYGINQPQTISV